MQTLFQKSIFMASCLLVSSCTSLDHSEKTVSSPLADGLTIHQDGKRLTPSRLDGNVYKYVLRAAPFSIQITTLYQSPDIRKHVPVQVCLTPDDKLFAVVRTSPQLRTFSCYRLGTGMAPAEGSGPTKMPLYVGNGYAHNYFSSDRRENLSTLLQLNISEVLKPGQSQIQNEPVFAIIFMNTNRDDRIDQNEYALLELSFQSK